MELVKSSVGSLTSVSMGTYFKIFGSSAFVVLALEHFGRKTESNVRPSTALTWTADRCKNGFKRLGEQFAWLSSYLTQLDLKDVGLTIHDVAKPTFDLAISPFYSIYGYLSKAASYREKMWLVYLGSGLMTTFLFVGWYQLAKMYPSLNIWRLAYEKVF